MNTYEKLIGGILIKLPYRLVASEVACFTFVLLGRHFTFLPRAVKLLAPAFPSFMTRPPILVSSKELESLLLPFVKVMRIDRVYF